MQVIEIILVIAVMFSLFSIFVFVFTIIWFRKNIKGWWFKLRHLTHYVESHIIMPNKQEIINHVLHDNSSTFDVWKHKYIIDTKCYVYRKGRPLIYHFYDNPHPINFNTSGKPEIDAANLKLLLDSKVIRDVLTEAKMLLILVIMLIFVIFLCIGIILKVYGILEKKSPVPTK